MTIRITEYCEYVGSARLRHVHSICAIEYKHDQLVINGQKLAVTILGVLKILFIAKNAQLMHWVLSIH